MCVSRRIIKMQFAVICLKRTAGPGLVGGAGEDPPPLYGVSGGLLKGPPPYGVSGGS